jgi:hypothetical protein
MNNIGNQPVKSNSPRICILKNFLPENNWLFIKEYCEKNIDKFEFVGYGSPVRWKQYTHSKNKELSYQRSFLMTEEEFDLFEKKQIPEPYPEDARHGDNYKMSMDIPTSGDIFVILDNMLDLVQINIEKIYGNKTFRESGPWLSVLSEGDYMKMHCDGTFIHNRDVITDFSCVYYVNDDFEGGEFNMPEMGFKFKPVANSLVLWSHAWDEDMAHEVIKVKSGNRFVSQGFFATIE